MRLASMFEYEYSRTSVCYGNLDYRGGRGNATVRYGTLYSRTLRACGAVAPLYEYVTYRRQQLPTNQAH